MSSFKRTGLYYFGTLPEEALEEIHRLLEEAGWRANSPRSGPGSIVVWTRETTERDQSPDEELRSHEAVITWFHRAAKEARLSSADTTPETVAALGRILDTHRRARCIMGDSGSGTGDDVVHPPHHPRREIVGALQAGEKMIFICIP